MFPYRSYFPNPVQRANKPAVSIPYTHTHPNDSLLFTRQQPVQGQATWTDGGQMTKCMIPWSDQNYMTAAVGTDSPYRCGQILKIRNLSTSHPKEIFVKVVDQVPQAPATVLNLHRQAFLALGSPLSQGIINIEILPTTNQDEAQWRNYVLSVTQAAYPNYAITDYQLVDNYPISTNQTIRTYQFQLKSAHEEILVRGNILYHPQTQRVFSVDMKEM